MKISELDTPVLLVDLDMLEGNVARMGAMAKTGGMRYRPHAKTHKSVHIARMQIGAGAVGVCCAKLGEAEVMAAGGIDNILITTPVVGESKIGRLLHACTQARIAVVTDSDENAAMLGAVAQMAGRKLDVLVEVDVGQGRCGVAGPADAVRLARAIDGHPWLSFAGLQGYQGKIQMIGGVPDRKDETDAGLDKLEEAVNAVEDAGIRVEVKTGGGTGTAPFDMARGLLTEIQPGSYVFMDAMYGEIGWPDANQPPFGQALHILTTVISKPVPGRAVTDAGLKAASSDHGPPVPSGRDDLEYGFGGDEHGIVSAGGGAVPLEIGEKLRLTPSHCDTTVNLYDQYIVVQGDDVVDVWPVDARGKVQ